MFSLSLVLLFDLFVLSRVCASFSMSVGVCRSF